VPQTLATDENGNVISNVVTQNNSPGPNDSADTNGES